MSHPFYFKNRYDKDQILRLKHGYRQASNKKPASTRISNPKEFLQVYENPLATFFPLLQYFASISPGNKTEKKLQKGSRHLENDWDDYDQIQRAQKYWRIQADTYQPDQRRENRQQQELVMLLRKQDRSTFAFFKQQIQKHFVSYKERMNKGRRDSLQYIVNTLQISLKDHDFLNTNKLIQSWKNIEAILDCKLKIAEDTFNKKRALVDKPIIFEGVLIKALNEKKQLKPVQRLNAQQQSTILSVVATYCALPSTESLHHDINSLEKRSRQIMRKLSAEHDQLWNVLQNLPWKESSFYWGKIIQCCHNISYCDHYTDIDQYRMEAFEAQFAGRVNVETLKKLKDNQWLDSCITSAVIEYLKQVEGGNNYHNDGNIDSYLFTHSETDVFINSNRDPPELILSYNKVIFLVNYDNLHWFVIAVYNRSLEIIVYDSLGTYHNVYEQYCQKITAKLRRRKGQDYKIIQYYTPRQSNTSDCGVFSIINILCVFDKSETQQRNNKFQPWIISQIRHSLFLFLLYLGYCRRFQVVPRKDYFDILFRSTIYHEMRSKLHNSKQRR